MRLGLVVLAILLAAPARAETPAQEVKTHLAKAKAHFDLQEYADAETELKAAYRIDPKPDVLYAIAQAQRLGGNCDKAIVSYKTYLRGNPPADQKKLAEDNIATCEAQLTKPTPKPDPKPDPKPEPTEPKPEPKPEPRAPQPPPTERVRVGTPWYSNWLAHGFVAGGAIAIGGGAVFALRGQKDIDAINDAKFYDDFVTRQDKADAAKQKRLIGEVGIGVGVVAIGVGALIYKLRGTHYEVRPRVARLRTLAVDPRGAVVLGWELP